jgi:hypothetical protein
MATATAAVVMISERRGRESTVTPATQMPMRPEAPRTVRERLMA